MSYIKRFPRRPGYFESIELIDNADSLSVIWCLYDEHYPGFEDHEYVINNIPGVLFRKVLGVQTNNEILRFLQLFFESSISSDRLIRFLNTYNIPFAIEPDDEWIPGVDEGEPFPDL